MELLSIRKSSENYVSKILDSNYIQTYNIKKVNTYCKIDKYYSSIDELIISLKEPDYLLTDTKDLFLNKIKLDIANKLDEDKSKYYDKYNYSKQFNTNVIQSGLQNINMLSKT